MTRLPRVVAIALMASALAAGAGCGSSGRSSEPPVPFDQPSVALRNVRMRGVGLMGGELEILLQVYNSNAYDLVDPRVRYRVFVDTVLLATGFADINVTLPARDSMSVRVPATFRYAGMSGAARVMIGTGAAPYRVLGRITVGTPYGRLTFPYDRAGRFSTIP